MFAQESFEDLLERIASSAPAPGSGAAAAAALALGIACLRKAVAVSAKDEPGKDGPLHEADARLCGLLSRTLAAAEADMRGFPRLLAARGAGRSDAEAAEDLVALADRIISFCAQAGAEAEVLEDQVKPAMANDLLAGRLLSEAAAAIVRANGAENGGRG